MPELTVPLSATPGKMVIEYVGQGGIKHSAGYNYKVGQFPANLAEAVATAEAIATAMAPLFNEDSFVALNWRLLRNVNDAGEQPRFVTVAKSIFAAPIVGTNASTAGLAGSKSSSITFKGRGSAGDFDTQGGLTMVRLFTGDTYAIPVATTELLLASKAEWVAFSTFLQGNPDVWADIYGQDAGVDAFVSPQFNAHWQKEVGA